MEYPIRYEKTTVRIDDLSYKYYKDIADAMKQPVETILSDTLCNVVKLILDPYRK